MIAERVALPRPKDTPWSWPLTLVIKIFCKIFFLIILFTGTTYSGYAYSFTANQDDIYIMRKWEGDDPGINNQKTPTVLLLTPEQEFHSFGFTARDFYHDLQQREAKRWLYFDKFKMLLHHNKVFRHFGGKIFLRIWF